VFSAWNKRYLVLDNDTLYFYEDDTKKKQSNKVIKLSTVSAVSLHYDKDAPVKSKKLEKRDKDESRFDVYTPDRVFMLKADEGSFFEAGDWVSVLTKAAKLHNP